MKEQMSLARLWAPRGWRHLIASSQRGSEMKEEIRHHHQVSPCDFDFHCDFTLEISAGALEWLLRAGASAPSEEG